MRHLWWRTWSVQYIYPYNSESTGFLSLTAGANLFFKKRETEVYLDYYHIYTWTEGPLIIPPIGVNPQIFFFLVFGKIRGLFIYTDPLKRLNESSSNYYILFFFSESILPCWWSGTAEGISQLSSAIWKRRFLRHFPRFPSLSHFPALKIYIYICLYLTGFFLLSFK